MYANHLKIEGIPKVVVGVVTSDEEALCFRDGGQVALSPVVVLEVAIARRFAAFRVAGRIGRIDRLQGVYDCVDAERPQSRVEPDVWVPISVEESMRINDQRSAWYTGIGSDRPPEAEARLDPTLDLALAVLRARIISESD